MIKTFYISLFFLLLTSATNQIKAQNERFHGGSGDGFGIATANFDMENVGDSVNIEIDYANGQSKYTNTGTVCFLIKFSKEPVGFALEDITITGTATPGMVQLSGSSLQYTLVLSQFNQDGNVKISIPSKVMEDNDGNLNKSSINTNNEVFIDTQAPVGQVLAGDLQKKLTNSAPVTFRIKFNEKVSGINVNDIIAEGTATVSDIRVSGSNSEYILTINSVLSDGTILIKIPAGKVKDLAGNSNTAEINSTETISFDGTKPQATIDLAMGQTSPALLLPLNFQIKFSEEVTDFSKSCINIDNFPGLVVTVSGQNADYNVSINGLLNSETVVITIPEGVVHDLAGNSNTNSIINKNTIVFTGTTGINNQSIENGIHMSYNSGIMAISLDEMPKQKIRLEVFDLQGRTVLKKEFKDQYVTIGLEPMNYYLIRISGNDFSKVERFITR